MICPVRLGFLIFKQLAIIEALLNFVLVDVQSVQIDWSSVLFSLLLNVFYEHFSIFLDGVQNKVTSVVIFLHRSLYLCAASCLHDLVRNFLVDALGDSSRSTSFGAKA